MTLRDLLQLLDAKFDVDVYWRRDVAGEEYLSNEYYGGVSSLERCGAFDLDAEISGLEPCGPNDYGIDEPYLLVYLKSSMIKDGDNNV